MVKSLLTTLLLTVNCRVVLVKESNIYSWWLFVLKAELKNKQVQEMNRFMHYYSRFKNHENSYKVKPRENK